MISNSEYLEQHKSHGLGESLPRKFVLLGEQKILLLADMAYRAGRDELAAREGDPVKIGEILGSLTEGVLSSEGPDQDGSKARSLLLERFRDLSLRRRVKLNETALFVGALAVDYPDPAEKKITLGSRLTIVDGSDSYLADIVGFDAIYPEETIDETSGLEVMALLPNAPLAHELIGKEISGAHKLDNGRTIKVENVDQESVKELLADLENRLALDIVE